MAVRFHAVSGVAEVLELDQRTQALPNQTFYVSNTGSNSNNGLTLANAWATLQYANDFLINNYDFRGNAVAVQVADGTYAGLLTENCVWVGAGSLNWIGNPTTPGNVVVDGGAISAFLIAGAAPGPVNLNGFRVQSTSNSGIVAGEHVDLNIQNIEFGNVFTPGGSHMVSGSGADLAIVGNYKVIGKASQHKNAAQGGSLIRTIAANTVTISGSPAITIWNFATEAAVISDTVPVTIVGNPQDGCAQYVCTLNGVYSTNGQAVPAVAVTNAVWANTGGGRTTLTLTSPVSATAGNPFNVADVVSSSGSGLGFNRNYTVNATVTASATLVLNDPQASSPGTYSSGGVAGYPVGSVQGIAVTGGQFG